MKRFARKLWCVRAELLGDGMIVGGILGMLYGLAAVHVPTAWLFAGGLAVLAGWRLQVRS